VAARELRGAAAAYRELREIGIAVESTIEHNVTRSVYFQDPDGNRVSSTATWWTRLPRHAHDGPRRDEIDIETGKVVSRGKE